MANQQTQSAALGISWTKERLLHQLNFEDVPQTFVWSDGATAKAVISFHLNQLHQESGKIAMIDLLHFADLTISERAAFARLVFAQMRSAGATIAAALGSPVNDTKILRELGFGPSFSAYTPMLVPLADLPAPAIESKPYLLFR